MAVVNSAVTIVEARETGYSCKSRGACPACNARQMAEVAAPLPDQLLSNGGATLHPLRACADRGFANPLSFVALL